MPTFKAYSGNVLGGEGQLKQMGKHNGRGAMVPLDSLSPPKLGEKHHGSARTMAAKRWTFHDDLDMKSWNPRSVFEEPKGHHGQFFSAIRGCVFLFNFKNHRVLKISF